MMSYTLEIIISIILSHITYTIIQYLRSNDETEDTYEMITSDGTTKLH